MSDNIPEKPKAAFERAIVSRQAEIMEMAAPNVRQDSAWLTRAKFTLLTSDCANLLTTPNGMASAMKAITDAALVGVSFGGPKPQCYPVPKDGKVVLVYSGAGFRQAAVYGPGAVLEHVPELVTVREGDGIRVDQEAGKIIYPKGGLDPFASGRGKVAGWCMELVFKDGRKPQVKTVSFDKVREIQSRYSMTGGPAFKKSPEEMDEKTAVKFMLRDVFSESAALAQMIIEGDEVAPAPAPRPVERDVTARTATRLDKAVETMTPDPEPVVEEEPEAAPESEAQAEPDGEKKGGDLFT